MATICKDEEWQRRLQGMSQAHLLPSSAAPEDIHRLCIQLQQADNTYPGGLSAYISRARDLLAASKAGANPFEGFTAYKPAGEKVTLPSPLFDTLETVGSKELKACAFVLVAGGLGERLGYSGIKIGLPCETTTGKTFAQLYCEYIAAIENAPEAHGATQQNGHNAAEASVPLAIMTSDDTHDRTIELFESHDFFGLKRSQVVFMKQGKVPALLDNDANIATSAEDPFRVIMKPHGHGDVHTLLHQHGLVEKWKHEGKKWIIFFQDTNPLIFRALAATLGVSKEHNFAMNTVAVPRKAAEAMGAICNLKKVDGSSITINVEYNVLGPLLEAQGSADVANEEGFSQFPGNTNALVFAVEPYCSVLQRTGGTVPEFVNPKYKDSAKTSFKSPTRLECMMQDFPRLFSASDPVGFTELERWFCYSCVKNNVADAAAKVKQGIPPECALSGEADVYRNNARLLAFAAESAGAATVQVGDEAQPQLVSANGLSYPMGPRIVLAPSWAVAERDMRARLQGATTLRISPTSTLVVEGDVFIKHLELDGAAVLCAAPGAKLVVEKLVVKNEGWPLKVLEHAKDAPVTTAMRGFVFERKQTFVGENKEPGSVKVIFEEAQSLAQAP
ncbi:UDP-sugar pyrophospharylase [Besnoitia besnoiti]|uniref:UTP-monosaccharide-1-phosphate uridylyltransferase n=1 Tax=Besnoitia besnoiti TaxID=94643 RepID=A0A2A9MNY7_BESBE|nr:UDP-sugar pyrophospharylase [Besnoitia besnoiti]PFH37452.1 UDP-sugar pyrophospharylase [Besnoitia besnoiti]